MTHQTSVKSDSKNLTDRLFLKLFQFTIFLSTLFSVLASLDSINLMANRETAQRSEMEHNMLRLPSRKMHPQIKRKFICFYYVSVFGWKFISQKSNCCVDFHFYICYWQPPAKTPKRRWVEPNAINHKSIKTS